MNSVLIHVCERRLHRAEHSDEADADFAHPAEQPKNLRQIADEVAHRRPTISRRWSGVCTCGPSSAPQSRCKIRDFPGSRPKTFLKAAPIADPLPTSERRTTERSLQLAMAAARTAVDNRGEDVAVLDMRSITPEFDYFVLATGNSRRQLHAIGDEIDHTLQEQLGDHRLGIEGYSESRWILLDYGSVVIHLFDAETRKFYALEDLWGTAERVPLPWDN